MFGKSKKQLIDEAYIKQQVVEELKAEILKNPKSVSMEDEVETPLTWFINTYGHSFTESGAKKEVYYALIANLLLGILYELKKQNVKV